MATQNDSKTDLMELVVSGLAMTDALAKLLVDKGVLTQEEFNAKVLAERATYLRLFKSHAKLSGHALDASSAAQLLFGTAKRNLTPF